MGLRKIGWILVGALVAQLLFVAPAAAYDWPDKPLKAGDRGRDVKALQVRLAGWYPYKDQSLFELKRLFSERTQVALEAFQTHYGLTVDGVAGMDTFKALNALEDGDRSTVHFDYSEFRQNRNSNCSREANRYAGTFNGGMVPRYRVKRNVRRLMWRLEALRAKLGDNPIAINSGFRSVAYNKCINGASRSQHLYGTAADLRVVEVSNRKARNHAKGSQVHGIGCYSSLSHNHLDLRMQNEALEAAMFWWWPKRDEFRRDLASDGLPCWGEVKRGTTFFSSQAHRDEEWSEDELNRWKSQGEPSDLHGLD